MKAFACALLLLAAGASAALTRSRGRHEGGRQRLASGSLGSRNTREDEVVSDVVGILQGFLETLQTDQAADDELSKEWECMCKNDTNMQQEINDLTASIATLASTFEEKKTLETTLTAERAKLFADKQEKDTEITNLENKEIEDLAASASTIAALDSYIEALVDAIGALASHNQGALLQAPQTLRRVASMIQDGLRDHPSDLALSPEQEEMVSLLSHGEVPDTYWNDYQNQSGTVFGILRQLHEGFESDLSEAKAQNETRNDNYNKLRSALLKQSEDLNDEYEDKGILLSTTTGEKTDADTQKTAEESALRSRKQALEDLTAACKDYNDKYPVRKKTREDEIATVTKAISILDSNPAYTAFKHANINFLQEWARSASKDGQVWLLNGRRHPFPEVKYAIQKLIQDLKDEEETEQAQHDKCATETQKRRDTVDSTNEEIGKLETDVDGLKADLDGPPEFAGDDPLHEQAGYRRKLGYWTEELVDDQQELKSISEVSAKASMAFLEQIAHYKEAQTTLNKAIEELRSFYNDERVDPEEIGEHPEARSFQTYESQEDQREDGQEVITLLQDILGRATTMETTAKSDLRQSQTEYEGETRDLGGQIETDAERKKTFQTNVVETELDLESKSAELALARTRLEAEVQAKAKVEESCTFLLENFDKRQASRTSEIEGLEEVIEILAGAAQ